MSMLNPFAADDALTLVSLTAKINNLEYTPSMIRDLGIFEEMGQSSVTGIIDEINETVAMLAPKPRNAPGTVVDNDKGKTHEITIPHIPQRATIMADEVQGVREFGTEGESRVLSAVVDRRLAKMRRQIDYTIEYHRLLALAGSYMDKNGAIQSAYSLFNAGSRQSVDFVLGTAGTKVRDKCLTAIGHVETGLGGVAYSDMHALCHPTFWSKFITHEKVEETFLHSEGAALRSGLLNSFRFGEITWHRYRGTGAAAVASGKAYLLPVGVAEMYLTRFAPANYRETVNTIGLPYYSKSRDLDFDKGVEIEAQSNVLNLCARPAALVELTTSN